MGGGGSLVASWLGAAAALFALLAAAIGVWKSTNNSAAIQRLDVKVDGRLTALLARTEENAAMAVEIARLLAREGMRAETDATAAALAETTIAATLEATKATKT